MRILVDGSALSLAIVVSPDSAAWREWVAGSADQLEVTEIAVTQMRLRATAQGPQAAGAAHDLAWAFPVRRFSDQSLEMAGRISRALEPFVALQVALAWTDPEVDAVATYDPTMAAAAELFGVPVISPGRAEGWWHLPDAERQVRVGDVPEVQGEPGWIALGREADAARRRAEEEQSRIKTESEAERAALEASLEAIRDRSEASLADTMARADARAGVLTAPTFEAAPQTRHFAPEPVVVEPTEFVEVVVPPEMPLVRAVDPMLAAAILVDSRFEDGDTLPQGIQPVGPVGSMESVESEGPDAEPEPTTAENEIVMVGLAELQGAEKAVVPQADSGSAVPQDNGEPDASSSAAGGNPVRISIRDLMAKKDQI